MTFEAESLKPQWLETNQNLIAVATKKIANREKNGGRFPWNTFSRLGQLRSRSFFPVTADLAAHGAAIHFLPLPADGLFEGGG